MNRPGSERVKPGRECVAPGGRQCVLGVARRVDGAGRDRINFRKRVEARAVAGQDERCVDICERGQRVVVMFRYLGVAPALVPALGEPAF